MRWVFYAMISIQAWVFVCAAVLLGVSGHDDGTLSLVIGSGIVAIARRAFTALLTR